MKAKKIPKKPPPPPDWLPAARKVGLSVQTSFVRVIKEVMGCDDAEAARIFADAHNDGKIVFQRFGGLVQSVPIYKVAE